MDATKLKQIRFNARINQKLKTPLLPSEYCLKWVSSPSPDERGYRSACIRAIQDATGLTFDSINNWGKGIEGLDDNCPSYVKTILSKQDFINEVKRLLLSHEESQQYFDNKLN